LKGDGALLVTAMSNNEQHLRDVMCKDVRLLSNNKKKYGVTNALSCRRFAFGFSPPILPVMWDELLFIGVDA
jgi:hypothetical protein